MKILIAMDTFFDRLYSHHANQYVYDGIQDENMNVVMVPLFESRKNMIDALLSWERGTKFHRTVMNGQLEAEEIQFASVDQSTMIIDAGEFLNSTKPEGTSSYGLGQLILNGIDMGHKHFIVSLGNVTVFDAGAGMLQALGAKFYDREHKVMRSYMHQGLLKHVRYVNLEDIDERLKEVTFKIVSDNAYHNYGNKSYIATQDYSFEVKQQLDNSIWYFLQQLKESQIDFTKSPYGGDGGALRTIFEQCFNAQVRTSAELIFERTHIETLLNEADLIIYGGGSKEETSGSLIVQEINKRVHPEKRYIYLTGGKQYLSHHIKDSVVALNIYPEITEQTENIQIGLQLQQAVQNVLNIIKQPE